MLEVNTILHVNDTVVSVTSQIELIKKFILGKAFRGEI